MTQLDTATTRPASTSTAPSPATVPPWQRYVAVGDSITEGLWDTPDGDDKPARGWADMLACHLSARRRAAGADPLQYANLAVRGRLLRPIVTEQVPAAVRMQPDLVSLIGGGNDILRPGANVDRLARNLEAAVARIRAAGADVLMATGFDNAGSPVLRATRPQVAILSTHVWAIARRHGAYVIDLWGMRCLHDFRLWAPDRIHLTADGHARVAQAALVALGLPPDDPSWADPLPPKPRPTRAERVAEDAEWVRDYAYPWMARRVRGTSSGDTRTAKLPTYIEV